jgi:hypothetical protein
MYTEINQEMEKAQQGMFRMNKINAILEELNKQQKSLEKKVAELKEILDKENIDVEKLENKSLAHLFYSVLGNLEERVEKEQQEVIAAKLKYDQAVADLEQVNDQITQLYTEQAQYRDCQYTYSNLYAKKKELLMASNSETANRLLDLSEQLNISKNNRREIDEAIHAGKRVENHLENAEKSLDSAEGWGTWDILGGGLLADMAKHSHIDDAKSEAERVQMSLMQFRTELADIKINNDIHFETDGFGKFADFFFDGLIADWCMQSRIEESLQSVSHVKNQVQQVLIRLNSMESTENARMEQIEKDMNELIARA